MKYLTSEFKLIVFAIFYSYKGFHGTVISFYCSLITRFNVEQTDPAQPDLNSIFKVSPQCGSLMPNKPATVNILFKPDVEVFIKDQPILPCQVRSRKSKNFI